jgi:hypothetical protein
MVGVGDCVNRGVTVLVLAVLVAACSGGGANGASTSSPLVVSTTEAVSSTESSLMGTSTTSVPVVTTISVVDVSWLGEGWVATGEELSPRPHPHAVTAAEFGVVAVGWACPGEVDCPAAAWVSEDGLTWTGTVPGEDGLGEVSLTHVVAFGASVFAAGGSCTQGIDLPDDCGAAIFASDDGLHWTMAAHDEFLDCSDGIVEDCAMYATDITTDGTTLIALIEEPHFENQRAMPWVSTDGFEWERATGLEEPTLRFRKVVPTDSGFTGVGTRWETDGENWWESFVVWDSPDGRPWTAIPQPNVPTGEDHFLWYVKKWAGGLVTFGEVCSLDWKDCTFVMWTSSDGTQWTRSPIPSELGNNGFGEAIRVGDLLVFSGEKTSETDSDKSTPLLTVTADLTNWDIYELDAEPAIGWYVTDPIDYNEMLIGVSAETGIFINQRPTN